ncbi:GNAT family N-acetyltransferase [Nocardioides anomalus]|uniref:GNAT family N-acetyltransferase n=1 Tax=Nocardioides anomalus TaxID=2712223 RepID=A0A6G6W9A9_9ACTN|nr:GNAT family N-acetyltransferase [Nocardioides anomalus]QIG41928.1 GNAT family N-acetyltransferase [Nocardioides anomalus]
MEVRAAATAADLDEVRRLWRAFLVWQDERHAEHLDQLHAYFDPDAWEAELAGLPGRYAEAEGGALLLARADDGAAVGAVALRRSAQGVAEMKRMYVERRGVGAGRALGEAVVAEARRLGYARLVLDTGPLQAEAIGLYRSLGFEEVPAYWDAPEGLRQWLLFFSREL